MAGTIFGLGLSQQMDLNGRPMAGALLYIYAANTSTPVTAYKNTGLTAGQEQPWPIPADANGRIPAFWLADGSYRARLTSSAGVVVFDEQNILAIGASAGSVGVDTTDPNAIFSTGMPIWMPITGVKAGWVRMNGRTIGNATSGGTERANADTQPLYEYAYANYVDAICPVSGGRGASAAADYAANKTLTVLDMRRRAPFGLVDMGNTALTDLDLLTFLTGDKSTGGATAGEATKGILQANLPASITLTTTIASGQGSHRHPTRGGLLGGGAAFGRIDSGANNVTDPNGTDLATLPAMSGTTPLGGSGTVLQTISPFMLGSWFWRL